MRIQTLRRLLPLLLLLASTADGAESSDRDRRGAAEIRPERMSCVLCREDPPVPIESLVPAEVESIGAWFHSRNVEALRQIDRLYAEGRFGSPGSEEAKREALRRFKVRALNAMDYLDRLARIEGKVYQFDEIDLVDAFQRRFANPGVYPFLSLKMGRSGLGAFCLLYEFPEDYLQTYEQFGQITTLSAERVRVGQEVVPMLKLEYPSGLHSTIELLYEASYCGQVYRRVIVDRGDSLEVITVEAMEGCFVRKAGLHRIGGFAFWRSLRQGEGAARVGAMAYLPAIHLRLPFFLPDIGFEDLREFDLPQPLWEQRFVLQTAKWPEWISMRTTGAIERWSREGPVPEILNLLFPDL